MMVQSFPSVIGTWNLNKNRMNPWLTKTDPGLRTPKCSNVCSKFFKGGYQNGSAIWRSMTLPVHGRRFDEMRWRLGKCSNVYQGLRSFFLWKWTTIKNPAMLVVPQHFFASLVIKWRLLSSIFKDSPRSDLKVWCNTIPGSPAQRLQILISPSKVCCANLVLLCAAFYFGQGVPERSILCFFFPIKETGTWIMWTWKTKDHGQDGHHPKWAPSFSK